MADSHDTRDGRTTYDPRLKARPTTYKGVEMRSRLEATFAAGLDKIGAEWTYEPRCFADETGQYLPDFQVHLLEDLYRGTLFVEVKPNLAMAIDNDVPRRMEIIRSSEPTAHLAIVAPTFGPYMLLSMGQPGWPWGRGFWMNDPPCHLMMFNHADASLGLFGADLETAQLWAEFDWSWE